MEKQELIVIGIKSYNFVDRDTGENLKGLNVHFLSKSDNEYVHGYAVGKANLPYDELADFEKLDYPFYAEPITTVEFSGNRPTIRITGFKKLADVKITELVKNNGK